VPLPPSPRNLSDAGYSDAEADALRQEVEFHVEIRAAIKKHSGEELDIKPYEADMRHLINTYIQAEPAAELGQLGELSLTELIIETGIHDAIARKLNEKGKLSKNAIAEGIINNVRKTIIRDQLTDPRFYEQMSKLLDDLIQQSRADTAAYEEFLRQAEALVKRLAAKQPDGGVPAVLHGKPEAVVLFNNLASLPATSFRYPSAADDRQGRSGAEDRPGHARARAGGLVRRPGARGAGTECAVPAPGPDRTATQAMFEIIKHQPGYQ
jgi:type I restriction enzyme R subunit